MPQIIAPSITHLPFGGSDDRNAAMRLLIDLAVGESVEVQADGGSASASISRIESLYVDNTRGTNSIIFTFRDTGRQLIVPPGAEGCYPTFSKAPAFGVKHSGTRYGVRVRVLLFSCKQPFFERFPGAGGLIESNFDVLNIAGMGALGIAYTQPTPTYAGFGGWDINLGRTGVTFERDGERVVFAATAIPVVMRHGKLRTGGKFYYELKMNGGGTYFEFIGLSNTTQTVGNPPNSEGVVIRANGSPWYGTDQAGSNIVAPNGVWIGFAVNLTASLLWVRYPGGWFNAADPAAGTGGIAIPAAAQPLGPSCSSNNNAPSTIDGVFGGGSPWTYGPPVGFLPWNG